MSPFLANCFIVKEIYFLVFFPAKCIDHYTSLRVKQAEHPDENIPIDSRLEAVVNKMFQRCFEDKRFKQVGIVCGSFVFVIQNSLQGG